MNALGNLKIGTRLAWGFGLLLTLLIGLGGIAARQAQMIYDALDYYAANTTPSLQAVKVWQDQMDDMRTLQATHIMTHTDAGMAAIEASIQHAGSKVRQAVSDYEKLLSDAEDKRLWQEVVVTSNAAIAGWDKLRAISRLTLNDPAKAEEARALFVGEAQAQYRAASSAIDKEWDFNVALARPRSTAPWP